ASRTAAAPTRRSSTRAEHPATAPDHAGPGRSCARARARIGRDDQRNPGVRPLPLLHRAPGAPGPGLGPGLLARLATQGPDAGHRRGGLQPDRPAAAGAAPRHTAAAARRNRPGPGLPGAHPRRLDPALGRRPAAVLTGRYHPVMWARVTWCK